MADCINVLLKKSDPSKRDDYDQESKQRKDTLSLDTACLQSALDILESVVLHWSVEFIIDFLFFYSLL